MYAKKSLGQHFLRSEKALRTIVEAGNLSPEDIVLEIGPGQGVLTRRLLEAGAKVVAVEKDDELFKYLNLEFKEEISNGRLELVHDDILKFIENCKLKIENYKLIANIPYNITGAVLEKFLSSDTQPSLMVLLVQDEVAKRIVARDKKESILSISVKAYGKPRYVERVLAGSFAPTPSVNSAIIAIEAINKDFFTLRPFEGFNPPAGGFSEKAFFQLLKAGFKSKRKKLSSNLLTICDKEMIAETFQKLGMDENIRAEDVSLKLWQELATEILG